MPLTREFDVYPSWVGAGFLQYEVLIYVQDDISCVLLRVPPSGGTIRGDPISQSQAHIPLKPLPPALDSLPEATSP